MTRERDAGAFELLADPTYTLGIAGRVSGERVAYYRQPSFAS